MDPRFGCYPSQKGWAGPGKTDYGDGAWKTTGNMEDGRPDEVGRISLKREHAALKNMKFRDCFLFLWFICALLDPDPLT
jgi:hypothetical protein